MSEKYLKKYISKEELLDYPLFKFQGKINLLKTPEQGKYAAEVLSKQKILGFDTESIPYKTKKNRLALIQLCTDSECFLFRVNKTGIPIELINIFEDKDIKKIGVAIGNDFGEIRKIKDFTPRGFIDLQKIAKKLGIVSIGLSKLSAIVLGGRISKRQQRSDWGQRLLTNAQITYAATDAWVALQIYKKLVEIYGEEGIKF